MEDISIERKAHCGRKSKKILAGEQDFRYNRNYKSKGRPKVIIFFRAIILHMFFSY